MVFQDLSDLFRRRDFVVIFLIHQVTDPGVPGNVSHSLSIGSVCRDQKSILLSDDAGQYRLHPESPAALHKDHSIFRLVYMSQFQQLLPYGKGDLFIIIIPGAMVEKHFFFYRVCSGQRTRCKQFIIWHFSILLLSHFSYLQLSDSS